MCDYGYDCGHIQCDITSFVINQIGEKNFPNSFNYLIITNQYFRVWSAQK